MADFKPRAGAPKRFDSRGPKASFGGKPSYQKKSNWADRGDSRSADRSTTLYKANCAKCGNECEVPFRPVNGKPVFCRNCFVKTGDTDTRGRAGDRFQKREFSSAPQTRAEFPKSDNGPVLKQLEYLGSKIDRLIAAMEAMKTTTPAIIKSAEDATEETSSPKKVKKGYPKKSAK